MVITFFFIAGNVVLSSVYAGCNCTPKLFRQFQTFNTLFLIYIISGITNPFFVTAEISPLLIGNNYVGSYFFF